MVKGADIASSTDAGDTVEAEEVQKDAGGDEGDTQDASKVAAEVADTAEKLDGPADA